MPPRVINAGQITATTVPSVVCRTCRTAVEWKRRTGALDDTRYDLLWCPTCQTGLTTGEIDPPGAVVLVYD